MARFLRLWAPVAAWMAVILIAGYWNEHIPRRVAAWDKVIHAVFYGVLALLAARASHGGVAGLRRMDWRRGLIAFAVTLACGGFDEWSQRLVPRRVPDLNDWLADAAGGAAALLILAVGVAIRRRFASGRVR